MLGIKCLKNYVLFLTFLAKSWFASMHLLRWHWKVFFHCTVTRLLCKLTKKKKMFCMLLWYFFSPWKPILSVAMSFHYLRNTLSFCDYLVSAKLWWCEYDKKDFTRVNSDLSNIWPPLSIGFKIRVARKKLPSSEFGKRWVTVTRLYSEGGFNWSNQ